MRTPLNWLSEYVPLPDDTGEVVYDLTQIGLEVEEVLRPSEQLSGLRIVSVQDVQTHPNNSDLTVGTITDGSENHTVVTAAGNLNTNSHYVWAPPGARLSEQTIEEQNLSGVPSEGMLCSLEELQLTASSGALLELTDSASAGSDPLQVLGLTDPILDIDLTPNRSDCLSIIGIARDYATARGLDLTLPSVSSPDEFADPDTPLDIDIASPDRCRRYTGIPVSGLRVEASPLEVQKRLIQLGQQPRNSIVDATNYVLYEMGNPLHAFDRSALSYPITVRTARTDETLTTLDGTELVLESDDLVIADNNRPQALAGVMGGSESEVTKKTESILLEGAYFTPAGVRRTSSRHQLSTDSSYRFERGVDGGNVETALYRCIDLMRRSESNDSLTVHEPETARLEETFSVNIDFDPSEFESLIGYECEKTTMEERLQGIGCTINDRTNGTWTVSTPSWRNDLSRPEDLLEEIVRLDGYESIPSDYPTLRLNESPESTHRNNQQIRNLLTGWGYHETTTFSFLSEDAQHFGTDVEPHRVANPISREHATLRQWLLDSLLSPLTRNLDAGRERVNLFEIGKVFPGQSSQEPLHLALITTGILFEESWDNENRPIDFYDLKGIVKLLLDKTGHSEADILPDERTGFLSGRTAGIEVAGTDCGYLGQIEPDRIDAEPDYPVWGAELDLTALGEPNTVKYNTFSKQPVVKRDLDLVVDREQYARDLKETIRENAEWLEETKIFDLYRGDPLPEDKKSVSFRLHFRNPERTLNDDEVNTVQETVLDALRDQHGAYLRNE